MPLSIFEQLRMLQEYLPLLGFGQRWLAEPDAGRRALIVGDMGEWIASKTANTVDDAIVRHLIAILKTPEGEAMVRYLVSLGEAMSAAAAAEGVQS